MNQSNMINLTQNTVKSSDGFAMFISFLLFGSVIVFLCVFISTFIKAVRNTEQETRLEKIDENKGMKDYIKHQYNNNICDFCRNRK